MNKLKIKSFLAVSAIFAAFMLAALYFNLEMHMAGLAGGAQTPIITRGQQSGGAAFGRVGIISQMCEKNRIITKTLDLLRLDHAQIEPSSKMDDLDILIVNLPEITPGEMAYFRDFLAAGGNIIFAALPKENPPDLQQLLAINSIGADFESKSIDIFDGILIGGGFAADDFPVAARRVGLSGRARVYAHADTPANPLIWRTFHQGGAIYAMNGDFFNDYSGMGILAGLIALAYGDFIYPIVGTKTILLDNFPFLPEDSSSIYYRSPFAFARDVLWPDLSRMSAEFDLPFTAILNSGYFHNHDSQRAVNFFANQLFKHGRGELRNADNSPDAAAFLLPGWDGAFEWASEAAVKIPRTSGGIDGGRGLFAMQSAATAMGFAMHHIDFAPVFAREYDWPAFSRRLDGFFSQSFAALDFLETTTASRAAESLKNYLNTNIYITRRANGMDLEINGNDLPVSFILRTTRQFSGNFADIQKIGRGIYKITVIGDNLSIDFE